MKKILANIGYILLFLYGFGVMIFGTYFEWQFAVENGFFAWLFFGWFIPAIQGIFWPLYFIF